MALKTLGSDDETGGGIMSEINITPLTDVFLVLLIIFMVTSSVMSQLGVDVNLPTASTVTASSQPEGVIVTLLPGGKILVNQKPVATGDYLQFELLMKETFTKTKSRLVILEGDREAFLGSAIEVMDHSKIAGAEKFAIATSAEKKK